MSEVKCPKCGRTDKQNKKGLTAVGSQRCFCNICHYKYTPERKKWVYTEKQRKQALQLLMLGYSGRAVGKALGMSKSNVYRWAIE
ncbi:MAG: hypothetical protein FWD91_04245, partial [Treponema sp.]|nr:hypothetical protein [Treponema sp.]